MRAKEFTTESTQTQSPEFKRWFSGSKIVNSDGSPMILYHGTVASFDAFKRDRNGLIFFATDPGFADEHISDRYSEDSEGINLIPVYINSKNPWDFNNPTHLQRLIAQLETDGYFEGFTDDNIDEVTEALSEGDWMTIEQMNGVVPSIRKLGFDSIWMTESSNADLNLAVFSPTQIKSAVGNRGSFKRFNTKITHEDVDSGNQDIPRIGINVRSDIKAGLDYADLIVDGKKYLETRSQDKSMRPYIGKRVSIIRTGKGTAKAIGAVTVGEPIVADEATFRKLERKHLVPPESDFDIVPGEVKYLYPMLDPVRYDKEYDVARYGMVGRRVMVDEYKDTPEFKNWFDKSVTTDKEGNPQTFYHATSASKDFDTFNTRDSTNFGSHFGSNTLANWYADSQTDAHKRIMPVHLAFKNPLRLIDNEDYWTDDVILGQLNNLGLINDAQHIKAEKIIDTIKGYKNKTKFLHRLINKLGYDSIVYLNRYEIPDLHVDNIHPDDIANLSDEEFKKKYPDAEDSYIALRPNQIKSTVGNKGTFDPKSGSIIDEYKDTPEFQKWFDKSVTTDPEGNPQTFYHATDKGDKEDSMGFSSFNTNRLDSLGAHFGSLDQASHIADKGAKYHGHSTHRIYPVHLAVRNPVRLEDRTGEWYPLDILSQLADQNLISDEEYNQLFSDLQMHPDGGLKAIRELIEDLGYDSIIYLNRFEGFGPTEGYDRSEMTDEEFKEKYPKAHDSYIILNPTHIKSTIGNKGSFDPNDPSIVKERYSRK